MDSILVPPALDNFRRSKSLEATATMSVCSASDLLRNLSRPSVLFTRAVASAQPSWKAVGRRLAIHARGPSMRIKDLCLQTAIVFGIHQLLGALLGWAIFGKALGDVLGAAPREVTVRMWAIPVSGLVWSFVFVRLFNMIRNERSIREGLVYGAWIGIVVTVPASANAYIYTPGAAAMPLSIGVFVIGIIQALACGAVLSRAHPSRPARA